MIKLTTVWSNTSIIRFSIAKYWHHLAFLSFFLEDFTEYTTIIKVFQGSFLCREVGLNPTAEALAIFCLILVCSKHFQLEHLWKSSVQTQRQLEEDSYKEPAVDRTSCNLNSRCSRTILVVVSLTSSAPCTGICCQTGNGKIYWSCLKWGPNLLQEPKDQKSDLEFHTARSWYCFITRGTSKRDTASSDYW